MKDSRYLLYIDILGFSNLVKDNNKKINSLFDIINDLNVHRHDSFKTIVFSDTILVFNKYPPKNKDDHSYLVMYACEFAQDLMFRCIDIDIQFRAILTYGEFHYSKLDNIEAYHGKALVSAYKTESSINSIGLFIDKELLKYCKVFKNEEFDENLHFVFLTQNMERLNVYASVPIDSSVIDMLDYFPYLKEEVKMVRNLFENIRIQKNSKIRGKYLQAYHSYRNRYPTIIEHLEKNNFEYKSISPDANW